MMNKENLIVTKHYLTLKGITFIPVKEIDMIYLDYNTSVNTLDEAYIKAKEIVEEFEVEVILHFNGFDMVISENTTLENLKNQYLKLHEMYYKLYIEEEFEKATKNLTIENAKRKLEEVSRLLNDNDGFKKYIAQYELKKLSEALYNAYKINQPDQYLDSMVEEAKTLKKTKFLNNCMN